MNGSNGMAPRDLASPRALRGGFASSRSLADAWRVAQAERPATAPPMSLLSSQSADVPTDRDPFSRTCPAPGSPNWNRQRKTGFRTFKDVPFQQSVVDQVAFGRDGEPQVKDGWRQLYQGHHGIPTQHTDLNADAQDELKKKGFRRYDHAISWQNSVVDKVLCSTEGGSQFPSHYHRLYDGHHGKPSVKEGSRFDAELQWTGRKHVDVTERVSAPLQDGPQRPAGIPTWSPPPPQRISPREGLRAAGKPRMSLRDPRPPI